MSGAPILLLLVALWGAYLVPLLLARFERSTDVRSADRFRLARRALSSEGPARFVIRPDGVGDSLTPQERRRNALFVLLAVVAVTFGVALVGPAALWALQLLADAALGLFVVYLRRVVLAEAATARSGSARSGAVRSGAARSGAAPSRPAPARPVDTDAHKAGRTVLDAPDAADAVSVTPRPAAALTRRRSLVAERPTGAHVAARPALAGSAGRRRSVASILRRPAWAWMPDRLPSRTTLWAAAERWRQAPAARPAGAAAHAGADLSAPGAFSWQPVADRSTTDERTVAAVARTVRTPDWDDSSWIPVPVPAPLYASAPVAAPTVLDLTVPGRWTAQSVLAEIEAVAPVHDTTVEMAVIDAEFVEHLRAVGD